MGRRVLFCSVVATIVLSLGAPAFACGGLIGARGAVQLLKTVTFAGYHDGIEHYVTSFSFAGGGGGKFGSIVPLPGVPAKVERAGDWTLQRLLREVAPPPPRALDVAVTSVSSAAGAAQVILQTRVGALDITVLKGGASEVGVWAENNGFDLPPDSPEVLEFYARRSPIFMAARFDAKAAVARGLRSGDGTPIHVVIPTRNPWVPLRILGLGKQAAERITADVFLLTDRKPAMLPAPAPASGTGPVANGLTLERSVPASAELLFDLRTDKKGDWIPERGMWFSYLKLDSARADLGYDLAIDASGAGRPSYVAAGFPAGVADAARHAAPGMWIALALAALAAFMLAAVRGTSKPSGTTGA
jgi:hypothetical protein